MARRALYSAILSVVFVIAVPLATQAAVIDNGSFEDGAFPDGLAFLMLTAGTPGADAATGWTVTGGSVDWINGFWPAQDGTKSLDMNGLEAGTITQTLATPVGSTVVVQFYMAGNPDCGPGDKTLTVSATGAAPQSYTFTNTAATTRSDMGWTVETYTFVATGASTPLTLAADPSNTSFCGPALDSVSATMTLAATGADCKGSGWQSMSDDSGNPFKNQGDCVSFFATRGATPIGR